MNKSEIVGYLDSLHSRIIRSSFAEYVTRNEIIALVECKKMIEEYEKCINMTILDDMDTQQELKELIAEVGCSDIPKQSKKRIISILYSQQFVGAEKEKANDNNPYYRDNKSIYNKMYIDRSRV